MTKPIEGRIRDCHFWQSGEGFTAHEMAINIKAKRNSVVSALRRMGDDVIQLEPRNGAPVYACKNKLANMLHQKMVSGEFSHTTPGPLEWHRRRSAQ